jgi:Protein of unknown function (DUF2630)
VAAAPRQRQSGISCTRLSTTEDGCDSTDVNKKERRRQAGGTPTRRETLEFDALLADLDCGRKMFEAAERRARTYLVCRGVIDQRTAISRHSCANAFLRRCRSRTARISRSIVSSSPFGRCAPALEQQASSEHSEADGRRDAELTEAPDTCWDRLRQRRARREAGLEPGVAPLRDESVVESYEQQR